MDNFSLDIDLGNEAMRTHEDVANALRDVADSLDESTGQGWSGIIRDANGNHVGGWAFDQLADKRPTPLQAGEDRA